VPDIDLLTLPLRAAFDQNVLLPGNRGSTERPLMIDGVGVTAQTGDWDFDWENFMPLNQVVELERTRWRRQQEMMQGAGVRGGTSDFPLDNAFERAFIVVNDINNVEAVAERIRGLGFDEWAVSTDTQWIIIQQEQTQSLQTLLAAVGLVALIIAAIGIMNTMIMSIYERTKEIGVMKVIGATVKDIRRLFLLEAAMIGAIGGIVGLLVSAGASHLFNSTEMAIFGVQMWNDNPNAVISYIPTWLYVLAFSFSCGVGVVSGFWPAMRATRISALAAIRTD